MSETISVGVVGPSHWVYMAKVMAEVLGKVVQNPRLVIVDIPVGVLHGAVQFSKLVLEGVEPFSSPNPPASLNAFVMAKKVMEKITGHYPDQREVGQLLWGCRAIVGLTRFTCSISKFNHPEIFQALGFMAKFFYKLSEMGEEERFEKVMSGKELDE